MTGTLPAQLPIDPQVPRRRKMFVEAKPVVFLKSGIHATLKRVEPQQMGRKTVQRADLPRLTITQSCRRPGDHLLCREALVRAQVRHRDGTAINGAS